MISLVKDCSDCKWSLLASVTCGFCLCKVYKISQSILFSSCPEPPEAKAHDELKKKAEKLAEVEEMVLPAALVNYLNGAPSIKKRSGGEEEVVVKELNKKNELVSSKMFFLISDNFLRKLGSGLWFVPVHVDVGGAARGANTFSLHVLTS